MTLGGKPQFYEFLQSITNSEILVRNNEQFETNAFIDTQTKSITVAMVAFSAEYGIASIISITALLSTDVKVDYSVAHFASLEGENLERYRTVSTIGLLLAVIIVIEKIITVMHKDFQQEKRALAVDLVIQVLSYAYPTQHVWSRNRHSNMPSFGFFR